MYRVEVYLKSQLPDARGLGLSKDIQDLGITTAAIARTVKRSKRYLIERAQRRLYDLLQCGEMGG